MPPLRKRILCPSYHLFSIVMTENAWDRCLSLVTLSDYLSDTICIFAAKNNLFNAMNPSTEYERFAQEVYQQLLSCQHPNIVIVQHNIKLEGRSGCKHQIDVYLEYEKDGVNHRVAIECKNYNRRVYKEKACAFKGVLIDLDGVEGIMASKKGFQSGAKQYAKAYGISLHELREPEGDENKIGEMSLGIHTEIKRPLYKVDKVWASKHNIYVPDGFIYLPPVDDKLRDSKGIVITSLRTVEDGSTFEDAYVRTIPWGAVKILEVKYAHKTEDQQRNFTIDAGDFVKAILKDAFGDSPGIRIMRPVP